MHVGMYILLIFIVLGIIIAIQYAIDIQAAYERLNHYTVKTIITEYGKLSYMDEGSGEAILISHGIFGGYDQGFVSLEGLVGNGYRKIAPSRFGYPGSDLPPEPTPKNQAKAFLNLLDNLGIQKAYILTTSAGGAAGISFAIEYPERVKGLILLSSGVPAEKKTREEIKGMQGPPAPIVNNFPMWLSTKYFGFIFKSMFNSDINNAVYNTMLPVKPRKEGIMADETITNLDMDINFDDYKVEKITAPILVVHAKDDPMAKYESAQKFIARTNAKTAIFETGGHLITGHGDAVSIAMKKFIEETK
jgi:pimeloyl-ACP methyl ester carboxylesterase